MVFWFGPNSLLWMCNVHCEVSWYWRKQRKRRSSDWAQTHEVRPTDDV
jgi:hypothetical protein